MQAITVISLGGSIISPAGVDDAFLKSFRSLILTELDRNPERKFILVCGGGAPAREYQRAFGAVIPGGESERADRIGIAATRLNAELLRHIFAPQCGDDVVADPTDAISFTGKILVASGWKPGFSTDFIAVTLAECFGAESVLNLSNIAKVYTADPKQDPAAKPLDDIGWPAFRKIVGDTWVPGKNTPFDPIASKKAAAMGLTVIIAAGNNLDNLRNILDGKSFTGTVIHR